MKHKPQYHAIIIGAGAAGLMAAIAANRRGKNVLILEHNDRVGKKILISGGGRCNFTNLSVSHQDYVSQNPHFCRSALKQFSEQDFITMVSQHGVVYFEKKLGQLFCKGSSREILHMLQANLDDSLSRVECKARIQSVQQTENGYVVMCGGKEFTAPKLVVATGGLSLPRLGTSDLGYRLAKQFGHDIIGLSPALDGFVFAKDMSEKHSSLAGVSQMARVAIHKQAFTEELLWTHTGLSGPSILKASLYWQEGDAVTVDFLPQMSSLEDFITEGKVTSPKKQIKNALKKELPANFVDVFLKDTEISEKNFADVSKADTKQLTQLLKEFRFIPVSTVGYHKAEVTRGGVSTQAISSKTMESQLSPGLYFVGEVVDVTGLLGGYNFQWAWSSGWVAGNHL